jgi:hypothetical protein
MTRRIISAFLLLVALSVAGHATMMTTGTGAPSSGTPPPPVCFGVVDLSAGCGLPMLGGVP